MLLLTSSMLLKFLVLTSSVFLVLLTSLVLFRPLVLMLGKISLQQCLSEMP